MTKYKNKADTFINSFNEYTGANRPLPKINIGKLKDLSLTREQEQSASRVNPMDDRSRLVESLKNMRLSK